MQAMKILIFLRIVLDRILEEREGLTSRATTNLLNCIQDIENND